MQSWINRLVVAGSGVILIGGMTKYSSIRFAVFMAFSLMLAACGGGDSGDDGRKTATEQAAAEGVERLEAEPLEAERLEAERLEAERLEAERLEAERLEAERLEAERLEAERLEAERLEAERLEAERLEAEHLEAERLEAERLEAERLEAERLEAERLEAERLEAERLEAERLEAARHAGCMATESGDSQICLTEEEWRGHLLSDNNLEALWQYRDPNFFWQPEAPVACAFWHGLRYCKPDVWESELEAAELADELVCTDEYEQAVDYTSLYGAPAPSLHCSATVPTAGVYTGTVLRVSDVPIATTLTWSFRDAVGCAWEWEQYVQDEALQDVLMALGLGSQNVGLTDAVGRQARITVVTTGGRTGARVEDAAPLLPEAVPVAWDGTPFIVDISSTFPNADQLLDAVADEAERVLQILGYEIFVAGDVLPLANIERSSPGGPLSDQQSIEILCCSEASGTSAGTSWPWLRKIILKRAAIQSRHVILHELYHILGFAHPDEEWDSIVMSEVLMDGGEYTLYEYDHETGGEHWRVTPTRASPLDTAKLACIYDGGAGDFDLMVAQ